jgi:hypothetical protein
MLLRIHLTPGNAADGFQKDAYYCFGMARLLYCASPPPHPRKTWPDIDSIAARVFQASTRTANFG